MKKIINNFYYIKRSEIKTIKNALNYCYHRIKKHGKTQAGNFDKIQQLRKDLKCKMKYEKTKNLFNPLNFI